MTDSEPVHIEIDASALDEALAAHRDAIQRALPPAILLYAWDDLPEALQVELVNLTDSANAEQEFIWYAVIPERYKHHDLFGDTGGGVHTFAVSDGYVGHIYWNRN